MKAPPPLEQEDQKALVELLQQPGVLNPQWVYTHIPSGEKRDIRTAMKLKAMGVMPGFPDFIFAHQSGRVFWLELKRRGSKARVSFAQQAMRDFLQRGGNYLLTDDIDDAIGTLHDLGIVRAMVSA